MKFGSQRKFLAVATCGDQQYPDNPQAHPIGSGLLSQWPSHEPLLENEQSGGKHPRRAKSTQSDISSV
jgi:hypothetical protein